MMHKVWTVEFFFDSQMVMPIRERGGECEWFETCALYNGVFCMLRPSDHHNCPYDYQALGRQEVMCSLSGTKQSKKVCCLANVMSPKLSLLLYFSWLCSAGSDMNALNTKLSREDTGYHHNYFSPQVPSTIIPLNIDLPTKRSPPPRKVGLSHGTVASPFGLAEPASRNAVIPFHSPSWL